MAVHGQLGRVAKRETTNRPDQRVIKEKRRSFTEVVPAITARERRNARITTLCVICSQTMAVKKDINITRKIININYTSIFINISIFRLMEKLCAKTCVNICNQQQPRPTKPAATTRRPYYTTRKPKTTTRQPWRPTTRKPTTTTRRPWSATTRRPWRPATTKRPQPTQPTRPQTQYGSCHEVRKTTKLYVFTRKERGITLYKYSTSPNPMRPWQKLKASSEDGAIGESFSLYKQ